MAAFVTDQFRILNAGNFIDSVSGSDNSYYAFLGLSNPGNGQSGLTDAFGRSNDWDTDVPSPVDNKQYLSHYRDTSLFGKKITSSNARRVIRKIEWVQNTPYDMYRHDYSISNQASVSKSYRLYDANYYVITSDFRVYICIDNGSSGTTSASRSQYEPTGTSVEPFKPGAGDDGYRWKYLFSILPSDIIKFDSIEYIPVPNNWETSTEGDIPIIRAGGDNGEQIKQIYIENGGTGYDAGTVDILGDGTGGTVSIGVNGGTITSATIITGGTGYTYGVVDLSGLAGNKDAELIPIIPPSKGHGYNIYEELGADKVLLYARFDDSDRDFPIDTKFSQIGVLRNPKKYTADELYEGNTFSSLSSIALTESRTVEIGEIITQDQGNGVVAKGYVASFDTETKVLKYYQDRSLVFGTKNDQRDNAETNDLTPFNSIDNIAFVSSGGTGTIDSSFNGSTKTVNSKLINLGVSFLNGLADPEINKKTGDVIYINNRPVVQRDSRQKEDVKIILEF